MERTTCRISGEPLTELFSLGNIYVSDFLKPDEDVKLGAATELKMMLAPGSGLVQLSQTANFDLMYKRYWYHSGTNDSMRRELSRIVCSVEDLVDLRPGDVWIDIGCNDGTMLGFVRDGVRRIGFDPAKNNCKDAVNHADEVIVDYFSSDLCRDYKRAKVITSIAMFYDIEDPHSFVEDIKEVLDPEGLWVIQMSYLPLMLNQLAFDNICHEHLGYYSLSCLENLFSKHGMVIQDCQLNDTNGGSFRVYVRNMTADPRNFGTAPYRDVCDMRVQSLLRYENTLDLEFPDTYTEFFGRIEALKKETCDFIKAAVADGKSVWTYGASTKGNTLLQYFGLDSTLITAAVEKQEAKIGLCTVGTNIPIVSESEFREMRPDYALVLPWHFISEFTRREHEYLKSGGKFIVPCPNFEVISA